MQLNIYKNDQNVKLLKKQRQTVYEKGFMRKRKRFIEREGDRNEKTRIQSIY